LEHLLNLHEQFTPTTASSNTSTYNYTNTNSYNSNTNNIEPTYKGQTLSQIKANYLQSLPPGPVVDYKKATEMAVFFSTPMGSTIINYFNSIAVNGLNYYKLSEANYRLWQSIKIMAGADQNLYYRSVTLDKNLFYEFAIKASLL